MAGGKSDSITALLAPLPQVDRDRAAPAFDRGAHLYWAATHGAVLYIVLFRSAALVDLEVDRLPTIRTRRDDVHPANRTSLFLVDRLQE
jgi:hypothetical protein